MISSFSRWAMSSTFCLAVYCHGRWTANAETNTANRITPTKPAPMLNRKGLNLADAAVSAPPRLDADFDMATRMVE